jgi:hypothetical protein
LPPVLYEQLLSTIRLIAPKRPVVLTGIPKWDIMWYIRSKCVPLSVIDRSQVFVTLVVALLDVLNNRYDI